MRKKILAILMVMALAVTMLPGMVFAEGNAVTVAVENGASSDKATVAEAVAAVPKNGTATITLKENFTGGGVVVGDGKNITFDLRGYTWDITSLVGSAGTETNGMQLLKGSTVTIKNGTITSNVAKILIQNYSNLTLDGVELTLTGANARLAVSNNNGTTVIKNGTEVNVPAGIIAFDSDKWEPYDGGNVTLEDGTINGNVDVTNGGKAEIKGGTVTGDVKAYNYNDKNYGQTAASLILSGGTIIGNVIAEDKGDITISGSTIKGDVSAAGADEGAAGIKITSGIVHGSILEAAIEGNHVDIANKDGAVSFIGQAVIDKALKNTKPGDTVTILSATEGANFNVPEGVQVINDQEAGNVTVNGGTLAPGEKLLAPGTGPVDEQKNNGTSSTSGAVKTGDDTNILLFAGLALAALMAMAAIFFVRRQGQQK